MPKINKRVLYTGLSALFIIVGTYLAIQYANGNYRVTDEGFVSGTGLLSANSFPPGAEVYIDDRLATATDDTIYLEPKDYIVEIRKEGYSPWKKKLAVEEALVTQTNAQLFPSAPSITPLTFAGVENISTSPDGQKIVYYTASPSSELKKGLYAMDMAGNINPLQKGPRQITEGDAGIDLAVVDFIWSPDSSELMIIGENKEVIIEVDQKTNLISTPDISLQRKQILSEWEEEMYLRERQFLGEFPPEIIQIATQSAKNVYISPDKKRMLYTATEELLLPSDIVPALPASNTQPETRTLQKNSVYVYDREEDRNFLVATISVPKSAEEAIEQGLVSETDFENSELPLEVVNELMAKLNTSMGMNASSSALHKAKQLLATDLDISKPKNLESSPSAFTVLQASDSAQTAHNFNIYHSPLFGDGTQWFTDSKHILFTNDGHIKIVGYDASNNTVLYSGPFEDDFVYPWPDGSKLVILTSFSPDSPKNLYAIELKR